MISDKPRSRTLVTESSTISVVLPAHNEESTVAAAVAAARQGISALGVEGEVIVSASGCADQTARVAKDAGARVVIAEKGKGEAVVQW
ncbi:hypothetical protein ACFXPA_05705 [Amycolatopsis sp. NPDC059090]|uniref:hypothetical protein n=1 Tax=unclassified Amycolatopsis TaxID=2618356 RepID=UPI0036717305